MGLRDHLFLVAQPASGPAGWTWTITGRTVQHRGPLPSLESALADQHAVFARWNQAARRRGGWMWRQTARRWVATLPEPIASEGLPFHHAPCNRG